MPPLLLCGWDAADWHILNPLIDAGKLPHLGQLVERGAMGDLYQPPPLIPAIAWTSVATGEPPDRHGVLSQYEADPLTGGMRPVSGTARRVPALWNMLDQAGLRVHVVGWPASHPAETLRGSVTSNLFGWAKGAANQAWPIPPGAIHPVEFEATLAELRVQAADLTGDDLLWFVPRLAEIDQATDKRLLPLAIALAESITYHAAATWILEHAAWDFLAVHYPLIGDVARAYMRFAPPVLAGVSERDCDWFGGAVEAACRFQDVLLGRLLKLAGPGARVMVLSAHGFLSGGLRPARAAEPAGLDYWPRHHGMVCFAGDGVRPDALLHGARALDIVPTVLAWFGLPAASHMPGRTLAEAFENPPRIPRIDTWEQPAGDGADDQDSAAQEAIRELAAMGYADASAAEVNRRALESALDSKLNLAYAHLAAGRGGAAIELLEPLLKSWPQPAAILPYLAYAYLLCGRLDDCGVALDRIPESASADPLVGLVRGHCLFLEGRTSEALQTLAGVEGSGAGAIAPAASCLAGDVYRLAGRAADAERCYRAALDRDPDFALAHLGLAQVVLAHGDNRQAAEAALQAIGLQYDLAPAHFTLGIALARLRIDAEAAAAFKNCLKLDPENRGAKRCLALLARRRGARK
ncbi:MAG: alkaline phosphatase family protein [Acidobacteriia bacterium]|nr:alkaline phosphatase family protein [Terriglobia bacterium]